MSEFSPPPSVSTETTTANQVRGPKAPVYDQLRWLWQWSSLAGVRKCMRVRYGPGVEVFGDDSGNVYFGGFCRCHSVWACPLCAPAVRAGQAKQMARELVQVVKDGKGLVFSTLTVPHDQGDNLSALFTATSKAWNAVRNDRPVREWMGDLGVQWRRTTEVTHGRSGFHPHIHSVMVTARPLQRADVIDLRAMLYGPWCRSVKRSGWRPPSESYGVQTINVTGGEAGAEKVAKYVTKIEGLAHEMLRMDRKTNGKTRGMFTILADAVAGDEWAKSVWHAYENGTKGRRAIAQSAGWREEVSRGVVLTDEEAAALVADNGYRLLGCLDARQADALVLAPGGFQLFADAVGDGTLAGWEAGMRWLQGSTPWWATEAGWQAAVAAEAEAERFAQDGEQMEMEWF